MPKQRVRALSVDWDNVLSSSIEGPSVSRIKGDNVPSVSHPGSVTIERPTYKYCTGSSYTGQWDALGMCGFGTYILPHNVEYEGMLRDGMFHGEGTLTYPMGQKIDGIWVNGKMVSWKFRFADGLEYAIPWKYCQMPDRRFYTCIQEGLRPAGRELLTNNYPARVIPEGCYDAGDGFYNPKTKCVVSALNPKKILRVPTVSEERWIMDNCRKAWDEPCGYKPEIYEHYISGRYAEMDIFEQLDSNDSELSPTGSVNYIDTDSLAIIVAPNYQFRLESNTGMRWWPLQSTDRV